jgi:hypothetical protein
MTSAIKEQNLPKNSEGPDITSLVIDDLELRAKKGVETYGKRLSPFNGRNSLIDAYQEALDLGVYLKQRLIEEDTFLQELNKAIENAKEKEPAELAGLLKAKEIYGAIISL